MGFGAILAYLVVFNVDVNAIWRSALRPERQIALTSELTRKL